MRPPFFYVTRCKPPPGRFHATLLVSVTTVARILTAFAALALMACDPSSPPEPDAGMADASTLPPDAALPPDGPPALGPCDPVSQSGCNPDQKCSITPQPNPVLPPVVACVPRTGARQALESCSRATPTQADDCAPGLACRGQADPRCLAFCADSPDDTCPASEMCLFAEDLDSDLTIDVQYCARLCDVLDQDCGQSGVACYPTRDGTLCVSEGAGSTPAGEGQICPYANSCAEGLGCFRVGTSSDWLCFAICDADQSGGPGCAANQFCNRHEDDDWGVCINAF